jgi:hypothetical protein
MAELFPILRSDEKVQVGDKLRLDASRSFVSPAATITKYEFDPTNGGTYIDAGTTNYMDWVYTSAGTKTAKLRITSGVATAIVTVDIVVVTSAADGLFSDDAALVEIEPTVMKYLPPERSSFKYVHRRVQKHILDTYAQRRIYKDDGSKIELADLTDVTEVSNWATLMALGYIFQGLSNAIDDVFDKKAKKYFMHAYAAEHQALRFDFNGDGTLDEYENYDLMTTGLYRR